MKTFRAGQQFVEYLTRYATVSGESHQAIFAAVLNEPGMRARTVQKNEDDAGKSTFTAETHHSLTDLRLGIGQWFDAKTPPARERWHAPHPGPCDLKAIKSSNLFSIELCTLAILEFIRKACHFSYGDQAISLAKMKVVEACSMRLLRSHSKTLKFMHIVFRSSGFRGTNQMARPCPPFLKYLAAILAVGCVIAGSVSASPSDGNFHFTVLEIPDIERGAGLAVLMRTPSGKVWLYDTGSGYPMKLSSDGWQSNFNAGRDLIAPLLKKESITSIDGIFISHAHYDHFGGLLWLKDHLPIGTLIDCGYVFQSDNDDDYRGANREEIDHYTLVREEFIARGTHLAATAGEMLELDPDLKIEVIAPPKTFFKDPKVNSRQKNDTPAHFLVNANSLALRIQFGDIVFLLPGDIQTEDIVASLLPFVDPAKLKCHILVAPGHGIHPIPPAFGEAAHPEVSIASVFERYARGIRSTAPLQALGAKTYITGLHGSVEVVTDGKTYHVNTEREDTVKAPAAKAIP